MSGFAAGWLALREPADACARAPAVLRAARRWAEERIAGGAALRVADLGAGSGSSLRLLAPRLPTPQTWMLIDDDAALLAVALGRRQPGAVAALRTTGRLRVRAKAIDLAAPAGLAQTLRGADLITASALFDLVSEAWCRQLVAAVARPGAALYAALTCDGRLAFAPADPLDATIRALFERHQRGDKGFGPALGPAAAAALARLASASGATVRLARSDWRLGRAQAPLLAALLAGWAGVARESGPDLPAAIAAWEDRRKRQIAAGSLRVVVGHVDLLATW